MRRYVPLAVGLAVLIIGTVWLVLDDSNPAAAVLVGSGLAIGIEGYRYAADESRREQEKRDAKKFLDREGLHTTRRLLWAALAVSGRTYEGSAELAGSVANALAHHSKKLTMIQGEGLASSIASAGPANPDYVDQIKVLIREISRELGDEAREDGRRTTHPRHPRRTDRRGVAHRVRLSAHGGSLQHRP